MSNHIKDNNSILKVPWEKDKLVTWMPPLEQQVFLTESRRDGYIKIQD